MTDQMHLFDAREAKGSARSTDPHTSRAAGVAATVPAKRRASQLRVLKMFQVYGDMHDKMLLTVLADFERSHDIEPQSPSGARSRRSELAKPNMDELDRIAAEHAFSTLGHPCTKFSDLRPDLQAEARRQLRAEGFRSELWDTGKREVVDGRAVIVWGVAR